MCRYRRKVVYDRARLRHRVHKTIDRDGLHLGGVLTDIFGRNGRTILDGLVAGQPATEILAGLTSHVRPKLARLARTAGRLRRGCRCPRIKRLDKMAVNCSQWSDADTTSDFSTLAVRRASSELSIPWPIQAPPQRTALADPRL